MSYVDPICARIIELLKAEIGNKIKLFVYGPIIYSPGKSRIPAISVQDSSVNSNQEETGPTYQLIKQITVSVITDWTDTPLKWDINPGMSAVSELCDRLDENLDLDPKSILAILNDNRRLWPDKNVFIGLNPNPGIQFNKGVQPNFRGPNVYSTEGVFQFYIFLKN